MTLDELQALVAEGESERLELKKTTGELRAGMESLCAMLNGNGGQVLFGVTDGGRILGQQVSDRTLRDVAAELAKLEPTAVVNQNRVPISETLDVLILEVIDRSRGPYTYAGRAFRRVGPTTSQMPQPEYERRLLERAHPQQRWENQPAHRHRIADLDEEEILRAVRDAHYAGRLESDVMNPVEALRKLNLVEGDQPNQAAVVAFAKDPLPDYPQCALRMARFRGVTKTEFLDQRQLTGNAFVLLHEAELFLRRHLPVRGRFESGRMERIDEPLFPPLALREALVNALCHRDYAIYGGAIYVAVYDDRVEIISSGSLPFGLTVDDLKREHQSRPRNPYLAEVFYRRGLIELWGRGTLKIVELCRLAGHPEPEFAQQAGDLVVRFLPSGYVPPHRVSHDLTERQRRLLQILSNGEKWKASDINSQLPDLLPTRTLRNDLVLLRELGLIDSSGRGPGARWWLRAT